MTSAVEVRGVTRRYGDVTAVNNVSLRSESGEVLGIVGPSGSGKTTLLRLIDLLEVPDSGSIIIDGRKVSADDRNAHLVRGKVGMVLQKPVVLNRSVANNIGYGLRIRGWKEDTVEKKVSTELRKLGLQDRRHKNARTLSGGEMQRLSFARATVHGPKILLLDEFAANLDPGNVAMVEDMVRSYLTEDSSRSVILVTHNIFQARRMCDRVALMWGGEMIEVCEKHRFFENPNDPRTAAFIKGEIVY